MAPQRVYLVSANTEPLQPAEASSELLADPEDPPTPGGWLRSVAGRFVVAVVIVSAIAFLFCISPLIQHRQ
jgi:hypothetical protein